MADVLAISITWWLVSSSARARRTCSGSRWSSAWCFAVGSGRRPVRLDVYRGVLLVCGVFVLAMSAYFVVSGVRFLCGQ
jgi:hypothetical protein